MATICWTLYPSRTAEIFGAVEVVVSSRKLVENKEFQNLSVTSEKWLKITEVQPRDLKPFLENLRMKRGYSVGEQSLNRLKN